MSMPLTPQSINVPVGSFKGPDGKPVQVYWNPSVFRYVTQQVYDRLGGANASTNAELEDGLQFDIREADVAELSKRVLSLEVDGMQAAYMARIAELEKRVADLEHDRAESFTAVLAEAIKRIDSLESAGSFA